MEKPLFDIYDCFRYIVPFKVKGDMEAAANSIEFLRDSSGRQLWKKSSLQQDEQHENMLESSLYAGIKEYKKHTHDNKTLPMGYEVGEWSYALEDASVIREFDFFNLPDHLEENNRFADYFHFKDVSRKICSCCITKAGVQLFNNQAGFLWYEIELRGEILTRAERAFFVHNAQSINCGNIHSFWEKLTFSSQSELENFKNGDRRYKYSVCLDDNSYYVPVFLSKVIGDLMPVHDIEYFIGIPSNYSSFLVNSVIAGDTLARLCNGKQMQPAGEINSAAEPIQEASLVPGTVIQFVYYELVSPEIFISSLGGKENAPKDIMDNIKDYGCFPIKMTYNLANFNRYDYRYGGLSLITDVERYEKIIEDNYVSNISDRMYAAAGVSGSCIGFIYDGTERRERVEDFYSLFMLNLHQYYGLILAMDKSQKDSMLFNGDEVNTNDVIMDLRDITLFISRCMQPNVSYLDYFNKYNNLLIDKLKLDIMADKLKYQLERVEMLCERSNEAKKLKGQERTQMILGLVPLMGAFSALVDSQGFVTNISVDTGIEAPWLGVLGAEIGNICMWTCYGIILSITITALATLLNIDGLLFKGVRKMISLFKK